MSEGDKRRTAVRSVIRARPRSGPLAAIALSLLFAVLATPVIMADSWALSPAEIAAGEPAPFTVRLPQFSGYGSSSLELEGGPIVVARGAVVDAERAATARAVLERAPGGPVAWTAYFVIVFLLGLLYTNHLNRSHRANLLRTQAMTLLVLVGVAAVVKVALMFTSLSSLIVPVAAAAILGTLIVGVGAGIATALVASLLIALLTPFDPGVLAVLTTQGVAAVMVLRENEHRRRRVMLAGLSGGALAAATYAVFFYLAWNEFPVAELADPVHSAWVASAAGGLLSGLVAVPAQPLYQYLLGDITRNRLVELEDLSHPLLKQIATNAPGTWQHSLAMANMAEIAANAIGAGGRLVRVGAYYHDLGKSLQPKYYVENLGGGESSPHDSLSPEVSCDAIFSHVTEGVRLGRKYGLPERVIDFMHMHHGDGLLEYFWAKCREQGNPGGLVEGDFRYPGVKPQSRETAILAICDAVEAASRTLRNPDERSIQALVQRIVYGKLHLGQLDESGLSVADLRKISNSLMETIKHAHHGRIEYPWQREEREGAGAIADAETPSERPVAAQAPTAAALQPLTPTQRLIEQPRLDSLDVPRPHWRARRAHGIGNAPTERVGRGDVPAPQDPALAETGEPPGGAPEAAANADAAAADADAEPAADAGADVVSAADAEPAADPGAGADDVSAADAEPAADAGADVVSAANAGAVVETEPTAEAPADQTVLLTRKRRSARTGRGDDTGRAGASGSGGKPPSQVLAELVATERTGGPPSGEPGDAAADGPPAPPPQTRRKPSTIELMKSDEDDAPDGEVPASSSGGDADGLGTGTMVLGPPPKSRAAGRDGSRAADREPDERTPSPPPPPRPERSRGR